MKYGDAKERAKILKTLGHPMRILIINALAHEDLYGVDLCKLGTISQSNVSRHIAMLKRVGIISDHRIDKKVLYHLETPSVLETFEPAAKAIRHDILRRIERTKTI